MPQRDDETPPQDPQQIIDEQAVQRPIVRAFHVAIGRCTQCRRRVQGRHPLQTSDALGAAAVQLGPQAVAFAVRLNKRFGLPYGKISALLRDRFHLTVTRGGLVHAVHRRLGRRSRRMTRCVRPCAGARW